MPKNHKITDKLIEEILLEVGAGQSLNMSCSVHGVPESSVRYRLQSNPQLSASYARARIGQARVHFDELHQLEQAVLRGDLDPQAFRVVADARKWRLAKLHPTEFGDKQQVELSGSVDIASRIMDSRRRASVAVEDTSTEAIE